MKTRTRREAQLTIWAAITTALLAVPVAFGGTESPLAGQACRADFNGDGTEDLAVVVPQGDGVELLMFLRKGESFVGELVFEAHEAMVLACKDASPIRETRASDHDGTVHRPQNAVATLRQPEVSSFAFFWDGQRFLQVQTGD